MTDGDAGARVTVDERSFVEAARREKRAALEAAGVRRVRLPVRAHARCGRGRSGSRTTTRWATHGPAGPRSRGGSSAGARRGRPRSPTSRTRRAGSSSTSARTRSARRTTCVELLDLDDHVGRDGHLFRTRTGEVTVRVERLDPAGQVAAAAAARQDAGRDGEGAVTFGGLHGSGGALPAALRRPRGASRGARGLPAPGPGDQLDPAFPGRAGLPRGRDADPAAALRRRGGAAVRDAPQRARHAALPADRRRAVPQAAARRRSRAGVRDRARLPQRGHGPDPQSRVHHAGVLPGLRRLQRHDGAGRGAGERRGPGSASARCGWSATATTLDFTPPFARVPFVDGVARALRARSPDGQRRARCEPLLVPREPIATR